MGIDQLRLFKDIAGSRSVSKGAAMNGISQSAASQQVQEMERELGIQLLDRGTRPLTLTAAGKLYLEFCKDVLWRKAEFDAGLGGLKEEMGGTVRVASIYSVGLSEMSRLEEEFALRCPTAKLKVEYLRPERVYQCVGADVADLGLISYPEATKEIAAIPWKREEMAVLCAPGHVLAGRGEVSPEELSGEDFIGFDEELPIRRDVDRFLREHGVEVNLTMHFDNLEMVKEAVELGSGISIAPARVLQADIDQGRLKAVRLKSPGLFRPLGIIYRRRKTFSPAAHAFLALLQETAQPAVVTG